MRSEVDKSTVSDGGVTVTLRQSEPDWPACSPWDNKQRLFSYRKFLSLGDGKRVMLRFLNERDRKQLIQLFSEASEEDVQFLKQDVKNVELLRYSLDHLEYGRALPLVAVNLGDHRFVGGGILLKGKNTQQHIGEVRVFVSLLFRNLGLGSLIIDELINLAAGENLRYLKSEVVTGQTKVIKALSARGFVIKALLDDYFICKTGVTHDVMLMMRPVVHKGEEGLAF